MNKSLNTRDKTAKDQEDIMNIIEGQAIEDDDEANHEEEEEDQEKEDEGKYEEESESDDELSNME